MIQEISQCLAHCPLTKICHCPYVLYPERSDGRSSEEHHASVQYGVEHMRPGLGRRRML